MGILSVFQEFSATRASCSRCPSAVALVRLERVSSNCSSVGTFRLHVNRHRATELLTRRPHRGTAEELVELQAGTLFVDVASDLQNFLQPEIVANFHDFAVIASSGA